MIQRESLLEDLQSLLAELRGDLRERVTAVPEVDARLREEHAVARGANRTAEAYEEWREEPITPAAVAWILTCAFVRFLEDNGLVDTARLSGRRVLEPDGRPWRWFHWPQDADRGEVVDVLRSEGAIKADESVAGAGLRLSAADLRQISEAAATDAL